MTIAPLKAFLATFIFGLAALAARNAFIAQEPEPSGAALPDNPAKTGGDDGAGEYAGDPREPLRLPNSAEAEYIGGDGWEYSGIVNANFVSARAQLDSWMQNQGWLPGKKITLDENIEPKIILTFARGSEEMTVFIWKISTMSTGFAYKRESETKKESANEFK